jgi:hypothetical protein
MVDDYWESGPEEYLKQYACWRIQKIDSVEKF